MYYLTPVGASEADLKLVQYKPGQCNPNELPKLAIGLCRSDYGRMPNAQSKEGTIMRVHSTFEVNTHQQENPFVAHSIGSVPAGKTSSGIAFEECLRSQFQQANATTVGSLTNSHIAGSFWNYLPTPKAQSKPETTLEGSAS